MRKRTNKPGFVYLLRNPETGLHKIGESKVPAIRALAVGERLASPLVLVHLIHTPVCARRLEEAMHDHFGLRRVRGEWFRLTDEDVRQIQSWGDVGDFLRAAGPSIGRRRRLVLQTTHDLASRLRRHALRLRMTPPQLARFSIARFLDLMEMEEDPSTW